MTSTQQGATLVERVTGLLPLIAASAAEAEKNRQVSVEVIDGLKQAGFFRALVPHSYGGDEGDPYDWAQACRTIARADMATAWVGGVLGGHCYGISYFSKRAQDEVWATGPDTLVCSSLAPLGKAERVDGGVRLSGRFPFASGSDHADWAMIGFILADDTAGPPSFFMGLVPRPDYRIEDDWFTTGMCATGSKSLMLDQVFVPEHRWFGPGVERGPMAPGLHSNPIYTVTLDFMSAFFAAVLVGGAEGALDVAAQALKQRASHMPGRSATSAPRQLRLGEASLQIRAAGTVLDKALRQRTDALERGYAMTAEEQAWLFADETCATRLARHGIDLLLEEGGASAQFLDRPLQRFWRDIHTGSEHVQLDMLSRSQTCGRLLVGLPIGAGMFDAGS